MAQNLGQCNLLDVGNLNYSILKTVPSNSKYSLNISTDRSSKSVILKSITKIHWSTTHTSKLCQVFIFTTIFSSELFVYSPVYVSSSSARLIVYFNRPQIATMMNQ
jgi:hypothetical protein